MFDYVWIDKSLFSCFFNGWWHAQTANKFDTSASLCKQENSQIGYLTIQSINHVLNTTFT